MAFREDLQEGDRFADLVATRLWFNGIACAFYRSSFYQKRIGEGPSGVECKLDRERRRTGNFYIEVSAQRKGSAGLREWTPSGIYQDPFTWLFAIGDAAGFCVVPKQTLIVMHQSGKYEERPTARPGDVPTRGMIIPEKNLERVSALVFDGKRLQVPGAPAPVDSPREQSEAIQRLVCSRCSEISVDGPLDTEGLCCSCAVMAVRLNE